MKKAYLLSILLLTLLLSFVSVSAYGGDGGFIIPMKDFDAREFTLEHLDLSYKDYLVSPEVLDMPLMTLNFRNAQPAKTFIDIVEIPTNKYKEILNYDIVKGYHFNHNIQENSLKGATLFISLDKNINNFKVIRINDAGVLENLNYKFKTTINSQKVYEITATGFGDILVVKNKSELVQKTKPSFFQKLTRFSESMDNTTRLFFDLSLIALVLNLGFINALLHPVLIRRP